MDSVAGAGRLSGAQKEELIDQVKQQLAMANAQELLTVSWRTETGSVTTLIQNACLVAENVGKMLQKVHHQARIFAW